MGNQGTPAAPSRIEPCRHMVRWVSALADGSLRGVPRWYTRLHVAGCPRCRAALEALMALRDRLLRLGRTAPAGPQDALTAERRTRLDAALDAVDKAKGEG